MSIYVATYAASISGLVPGATPQDIFTLQAAAAKIIEVLRVDVAFTETTAGDLDVFLLKRSTANTLGTFTNPVAVPYDSVDGAAGATPFAYTANPTAGTLVGVLSKQKLFGNVTTAQADRLVWVFGGDGKNLILRPGSQETLAVNLNGIVDPAGALFDVNVIWTER